MAEVEGTRAAVAQGDAKPERLVDALMELAAFLWQTSVLTRRGASSRSRRLARAERRESRASPEFHTAQWIEASLALVAARIASDAAAGSGLLLDDVARVIARRVPRAPERQEWERRIAELRNAMDTARPARTAAASPAPDEHYVHPRFGRGALVRVEANGLRLRFVDGIERLIAPDRVTLDRKP